MTEPSQLTIDGLETPSRAPETVDPPRSYDAAPLFTAPQTIRGQIAMPTDARTR